jgi:hypothetical protein
MPTFADWFPLLMIGSVFTTVGLLKLHALRHNIVGGGDKSFSCRLRGTCPTWSGQMNVLVMLIFLVIGFLAFGILGWLLLRAAVR